MRDPKEIPATNTLEEADPKSELDSLWIKNSGFMRDLNRLKELRSFLIKEAAPIKTGEVPYLSFGRLNLLRESHGVGGRQPTENEWYELEARQQQLFAHLDENLRKKYLLGNIPSWIAYLPAVFAGLAVAALYYAYLQGTDSITFASYLVWLVSLGTIGSVAFIGMNILSVQDDVTFDLSNARLMSLRIILGGMFALVLSLPFGYQTFQHFVLNIGKFRLDSKAPSELTAQAAFLLLPFILGFSTSLVIMILNRLIEAVKTFFGQSVAQRVESMHGQGAATSLAVERSGSRRPAHPNADPSPVARTDA